MSASRFRPPRSSPYARLDTPLVGRVDEHVISSAVLAGNPLGDPADRPLWVSVPAGWDGVTALPVVYVVQGYTGQLSMWRNRQPFRRTPLEAVDDLLADPAMPPVLVVHVDAWTSLGGSQLLDSPSLGRYASYLTGEVVPWVDAHYPTLARSSSRAIAGKSSGGYAAMRTAMDFPELFGAFATHAGDALFEVCYAPGFPDLARALRPYDASIEAFLADLTAPGRVPLVKPSDGPLVEVAGYSCAYDDAPDGSAELPFDPVTGALIPDVWARWLTHDPVRRAATPEGSAALAGMRGVWIDAGTGDDYHLDLGAIAFRDAALAAGLPAARLRFELFDATHAAIEWRYPMALRWLAEHALERADG